VDQREGRKRWKDGLAIRRVWPDECGKRERDTYVPLDPGQSEDARSGLLEESEDFVRVIAYVVQHREWGRIRRPSSKDSRDRSREGCRGDKRNLPLTSDLKRERTKREREVSQ
jgi:hypothetical protein